MTTRGPGCGAPAREGLDGRQQWDELLALSSCDARAGGAHVLTVASSQLQHGAAVVQPAHVGGHHAAKLIG